MASRKQAISLFACVLLILLAFLTEGLCSVCGADETVGYDRDVRPILADLCFACHGTDEHARQADLRLDQRESAIELSAIVPGDAQASELIARIQSDDPDLIMPPPESKKTVGVQQKETLIRWINQGAQYERHWSLVPAKVATVPPADPVWRKNPIDDFVAAKRSALDLSPAPEADPNALFRRLHLDITGLPPDPVDRIAFVDDYAQRGDVAYSEWIRPNQNMVTSKRYFLLSRAVLTKI